MGSVISLYKFDDQNFPMEFANLPRKFNDRGHKIFCIYHISTFTDGNFPTENCRYIEHVFSTIVIQIRRSIFPTEFVLFRYFLSRVFSIYLLSLRVHQVNSNYNYQNSSILKEKRPRWLWWLLWTVLRCFSLRKIIEIHLLKIEKSYQYIEQFIVIYYR